MRKPSQISCLKGGGWPTFDLFRRKQQLRLPHLSRFSKGARSTVGSQESFLLAPRRHPRSPQESTAEARLGSEVGATGRGDFTEDTEQLRSSSRWVAELRTLYGTGHGRSKVPELEVAHVRLVVNAAISVASFLVEVWQNEVKARPIF
jgi:hypothetical protein